MTILSDAEQIRDEVIPRANTAARVGGCLVDIANALGSPVALPYCYGYGTNTDPTIITTGGTFYKAVLSIGNSNGIGFTVDEFGVITCTYEDADGFYGLYNVNVVMSVSTASGAHRVGAALGSESAVDELTSIVTTLNNGTDKPHQIVMNFPVGLLAGDTLAVWLTDDHDGEELVVSNISITISRLASLEL